MIFFFFFYILAVGKSQIFVFVAKIGVDGKNNRLRGQTVVILQTGRPHDDCGAYMLFPGGVGALVTNYWCRAWTQ